MSNIRLASDRAGTHSSLPLSFPSVVIEILISTGYYVRLHGYRHKHNSQGGHCPDEDYLLTGKTENKQLSQERSNIKTDWVSAINKQIEGYKSGGSGKGVDAIWDRMIKNLSSCKAQLFPWPLPSLQCAPAVDVTAHLVSTCSTTNSKSSKYLQRLPQPITLSLFLRCCRIHKMLPSLNGIKRRSVPVLMHNQRGRITRKF